MLDLSEEVRTTLGRKIKELRILNNLSQEEFAEKAELNRSYVSSIENGNKNVTLDILVKIALCLDVTLPELFEKPANLSKVYDKSEIIKSLFAESGFFASIKTLSPIPGLGLIGLTSKSTKINGKDILKKYLQSQKAKKEK